MKTLFQFLAGGACGLFVIGLFWLAVELDNAELQAGKSQPDIKPPLSLIHI